MSMMARKQGTSQTASTKSTKANQSSSRQEGGTMSITPSLSALPIPISAKSQGQKSVYSVPYSDSPLANDFEIRMSIRLNKIDKMKNTMMPTRARELSHFQPYNNWRLDSKIPDYRSIGWPTESLSFSRGKLCQSLLIPKRIFDVSDPLNLNNPTPMSNYTALHDPNALAYFKSPNVLQQLRCQHFINDQLEVICNVKDYNQFRSGLACVQKDMIREVFVEESKLSRFHEKLKNLAAKADTVDKTTNEVKHMLTLDEKVKQIRDVQNQKLQKKVKEVEKKVGIWKKRIEVVEAEKRMKQLQRGVIQLEAESKRQRMMKKIETSSLTYRRQVFDRMMFRNLVNQMNKPKKPPPSDFDDIDKLHLIQERDLRMVEEKMEKQKGKRLQRRQWISQYHRRMDFMEKNRDKFKVKNKAKLERELFLMRKYVDMWMSLIRKKRKSLEGLHVSNFNVDRTFKAFVDYLKKDSGYAKVQKVGKVFFELGKSRKDIARASANSDSSSGAI